MSVSLRSSEDFCSGKSLGTGRQVVLSQCSVEETSYLLFKLLIKFKYLFALSEDGLLTAYLLILAGSHSSLG